MFEELKKKSFKKCLFTAIVCLIAGGCLIAFSAVNVFYTFFGYADFAELAPDKINFQLVSLDLELNFGCYLEESEYNTKTHVRKTTDLYYIILTRDGLSDDDVFMTIKIPPAYEKRMEAMADNTADGYLSEPIHFLGKVKKLSSEEYGHFKDCFIKDFGFTESEFEELTLPYYIDYYHDSTSMGVLYCIMFFGGIALFVIGVCRIVKGKNGGFLKDLRKDIEKSGYSESYIESDYSSAQLIAKGDDLKMGRLMTYYNSGASFRAIPHNKLLWAYQSTTTHRTNGIKTGTTYSVIYHVDGEKNSITVSVPNEAAAQEILKRLSLTCPWVIAGYTDDLNRMFRKNPSEFRQLRYNIVEHTPVDPAYEAAPVPEPAAPVEGQPASGQEQSAPAPEQPASDDRPVQ